MLSIATNNTWRGTKNCFVLGCLLFFFFSRCEAQNLVPNPGFEETDSCMLGIGFLPPGTGPADWFRANITFDHLQTCLPYGSVNGLPLNKFTFQEPYEGTSCIGLFTYHQNGTDEQREWIMVPLLEAMVIGETYYCSFRANAGFGGNELYPQIYLASSNVGVQFTTYELHYDSTFDPLPLPLNTAHVYYPDVLTDTVGWTLVSGSFVADSAYQYLMIGNFFSNALTDTIHFASPESVMFWYPWGYTLIDDVCITTSPKGCDRISAIGELGTSEVVVYPNPAQTELHVSNSQSEFVWVCDALGRVIWRGETQGTDFTVQTTSWSRGCYTLYLEGSKGVWSFKFMLID